MSALSRSHPKRRRLDSRPSILHSRSPIPISISRKSFAILSAPGPCCKPLCKPCPFVLPRTPITTQLARIGMAWPKCGCPHSEILCQGQRQRGKGRVAPPPGAKGRKAHYYFSSPVVIVRDLILTFLDGQTPMAYGAEIVPRWRIVCL